MPPAPRGPPDPVRYWYVLPSHQVHPSVLIPLCFAGKTLTDVIHTLERYTLQLANSKKDSLFLSLSPQLLEAFRSGIRLNQKVRWGFKRLAVEWLRRRKMTYATQEDLVTGEAPVNRVEVYDWHARRIYPFEARTLLKDSVERILLHDELWVNPHPPRNPYTNLPLSYGQLWYATTRLRAHATTHWTLEALASSAYNFPAFRRSFDQALRHSALKQVFRPSTDPTSEYGLVMLDFIEDEHHHFGQHFNRSIYRWALEHEPAIDRMLKWRKACFRYHEISVLVLDLIEQKSQQDIEISAITEALCGPPTELLALRDMWFKKQTLARAAKVTATTTPLSNNLP